MGEFIEAGYVDRLDKSRAGIHIGTYPLTVTYEVLIEAVADVLCYGSYADIYRRIQQTTLDGTGDAAAVLNQAGTISMSRTKRSVIVRPRDGKKYVINADALRDVMRDKLLRATISEVVFKPGMNGSMPLTV
jgi:hypothetical protein